MCGCGANSVYKPCGCGGMAALRLSASADPKGWWSDERAPAALLEPARDFVSSVLWAAPRSLGDPLAGAKALMSLMRLASSGEAPLHLDPFAAELPAELGLHPGALFVAGASASAMLGKPKAAALEELLLQATAATRTGFDLRGLLGGGRPVFEPPKLPPEWLLPPQRLLDTICAVSVIKAALGLGRFSQPTADADGISGLSANSGCPGQALTIYGSGFGNKTPAGTTVLVPSRGGGCLTARVSAWSDTAITIELPADVGAGCVGFLRTNGEPPSFEAIDTYVGEVNRCFGPAMLPWGDRVRQIGIGPTPCPPCLPNDANRLQVGGRPLVAHFSASAAVLEPGTAVTLTWSVANASQVTLTRLSTDGPWVTPPQPLPATGTLALGPFNGSLPVMASYELTASNACGSLRRVVTVLLSRRAPLAVSAIEVVQAVQRADNSLPLLANRRTSVRVFVASGLADGFDFGAGPNVVPNVEVRLRAVDPARGLNIDCGPPWNAPHNAGSAPNRQSADGALHFELPLAACTGSVQLQASVSAALPGGWLAAASGTQAVTFNPKGRQQILPILCADTVTPLPAPSMSSVLNNLSGSQRRQPFSEDGFIVNPPVTMSLPATVDLRGGLGWVLLTTMLTTAVISGPASGGVRCAIVPQSGAYPWGGMAVPRILVTVPSLICQADMPTVFAHELGHAYGLMHVDCGDTQRPAGPYDGRLPLLTDEPGIDAGDRSFKPMGTNELMSYCTPDWTSTAQWNLLFNAIPI